MSSAAEEREAVRKLISDSVRLLNAREFSAFVELFASGATYTLEANGPELGARMVWLKVDREELAVLLSESSQHVHDLSDRMHMVTVDDVSLDGVRASARSTFAVFRTTPEGATSVYAVGSYDDVLARDGDAWRFSARTVQVRTRMFASPTPTPL